MKRTRAILFILLAALILSSEARAQSSIISSTPAQKDVAANQTTESWQGVLAIGDARLRLILNLTKAVDGSLKATLDSPDQNVMGIPVDEVTNQSGSLHLALKAIDATYDATLSRDGSEMLGVWRQRGNTFSLILRRAESANQSANQASAKTAMRGRVQLQP